MTTAALSRQPKVVECSTLRSHLGLRREIHQLRVGSTAFLTAILLDETEKLLPLAGEREVARIALHNDWKVHLPSSCLSETVRFSQTRTMKVKVKTVYVIAAVAVVLALYLLLNPPAAEFTATYSKDVSRFGPDSVDVQMAMGTLHSDPPHTMVPAPSLKPTLLFPPSEADLAKLSGPPLSE
jgi:hypothetical protein